MKNCEISVSSQNKFFFNRYWKKNCKKILINSPYLSSTQRDTTRSRGSPRLPASKSPIPSNIQFPISSFLQKEKKKHRRIYSSERLNLALIVLAHCLSKQRSRGSLLSRKTSFLLPFFTGSRPLIHHGVGE